MTSLCDHNPYISRDFEDRLKSAEHLYITNHSLFESRLKDKISSMKITSEKSDIDLDLPSPSMSISNDMNSQHFKNSEEKQEFISFISEVVDRAIQNLKEPHERILDYENNRRNSQSSITSSGKKWSMWSTGSSSSPYDNLVTTDRPNSFFVHMATQAPPGTTFDQMFKSIGLKEHQLKWHVDVHQLLLAADFKDELFNELKESGISSIKIWLTTYHLANVFKKFGVRPRVVCEIRTIISDLTKYKSGDHGLTGSLVVNTSQHKFCEYHLKKDGSEFLKDHDIQELILSSQHIIKSSVDSVAISCFSETGYIPGVPHMVIRSIGKKKLCGMMENASKFAQSGQI